MAKLTIENTTLTGIADAIREKGGATGTLTPVQMPDAIKSIQGGGDTPTPTPTNTCRTPEEVYATERPAEWPVLPEPTQENEFYFLCDVHNGANLVLPKTKSSSDEACLIEWGYIDDNGEFVAVHTQENYSLGGSYWSEYGLGTLINTEKMSKYYVVHTVGADVSYETCTSSGNRNASTMKYVLEIKARISNPRFGSTTSFSSYDNHFPGCQFITLYGPQNWDLCSYKFCYMLGLRALLFDSEENNPFLHDMPAITTVSNMFQYSRSLQCYYPIENWSNVVNIGGAYSGCWTLNRDYIEFECDRALTFSSKTFEAPVRASIKIPNVTTGGVFNESPLYYDNLDVSSYTSAGHSSYLSKMTTGAKEIHNLKVGPLDLSSTSGNVLYATIGDTTVNFTNLVKVTMSPEQTGDNMPTGWRIAVPSMSYDNLKIFLQSLPTVTKGNALNIRNIALGKAGSKPTELDEIAVSKGYTITIGW